MAWSWCAACGCWEPCSFPCKGRAQEWGGCALLDTHSICAMPQLALRKAIAYYSECWILLYLPCSAFLVHTLLRPPVPCTALLSQCALLWRPFCCNALVHTALPCS